MSETGIKNFHGHEVMQMMVSSGKTYSKETLATAIIEKFGPDARFFTCSAQGMTALELIEFLKGRGKFVGSEDSFSTAPDKICDH